jgi:hypothetical protein
MKDIKVDIWRDIKSFDGYQISYTGEIRRVLKSGRIKMLNPYRRKRRWLFVKLKGKEIAVHKIVADAYLERPSDRHIVYHRNGIITDNYASNLEYLTREELGLITAKLSNRKTVAKINRECEIVDFYTSARDCARANYMSYQTIIDRCNLKTKSVFAPDGFAYAWDDNDTSLNAVIERIRKDVKR